MMHSELDLILCGLSSIKRDTSGDRIYSLYTGLFAVLFLYNLWTGQ